jgi:hypothetical protein
MHGHPNRELLEALMEGSALDLGLDEDKRTTAELIEDAVRVCSQAFDLYHKLPSATRSTLRGFSPQLLALAADQAQDLERAEAARERAMTAQRESEQRLLRMFAENLAMYQQGLSVLVRVGGTNPEVDENCVPLPLPTTNFDLARALERLALHAGGLLRSPDRAVKQRALLLGLDTGYANALSAAGAAMMALEHEVTTVGQLGAAQRGLEAARSTTRTLTRLIAEAFDFASKIDPAINALPSARRAQPVARGVPRRAPPELRPASTTIRVVNTPEPRPVSPLQLGHLPTIVTKKPA